jgi:K+-transporting ATPase A subunit
MMECHASHSILFCVQCPMPVFCPQSSHPIEISDHSQNLIPFDSTFSLIASSSAAFARQIRNIMKKKHIVLAICLILAIETQLNST